MTLTPESLARTIAKARHGTDAHWLQMMPAARAVRQALIDPVFIVIMTFLLVCIGWLLVAMWAMSTMT